MMESTTSFGSKKMPDVSRAAIPLPGVMSDMSSIFEGDSSKCYGKAALVKMRVIGE